MPGTVLGDVASRRGFTWLLSLPTWGVDLDGLAYPLHHPTTHSCQSRGHDLAARCCLVLSL
jgi:hypothetical protein